MRASQRRSMKHQSIRELFAYWHNLRGSRPAPERGDIEPVAIRNLLADVFILSLEPHAGHPFRVAGTRVCALFGREIKGESFLALFSPDARSAMRKLIGVIARESIGVVASVCEFDAAQPPLELILLPLAYDGRTDARVLGALVRCPTGWEGAPLARSTLPRIGILGTLCPCASRSRRDGLHATVSWSMRADIADPNRSVRNCCLARCLALARNSFKAPITCR